MDNIIRIPKSVLSMQIDDIIEYIYDYFNGLDIECTEYDEYYSVIVRANQYTYCEDISQGLNFLGISETDVSEYCPINGNVALCLSENWLPYAFACLLKRDGCGDMPMNIIHVDDHSDLMSPFIYCDGDRYYNMLSGDSVEFGESESLRKAVKSGAITIGSMLTVIVYAMEEVNVVHIKNDATSQEYDLIKENNLDEMLFERCRRISLGKQTPHGGKHKYFVTSSWDELKRKINPSFPCVLHIDMDYFNNRYNASTSWEENQERHDPSFILQKQEMDKLISTIGSLNEHSIIRYVLIGISPSFYPVEYWKEGLNYLVTELQRVGIGVGAKIFQSPKGGEAYE